MRRFSFYTMLCLIIGLIQVNVSSQTTLINPTAEGGFELGASFLANGWSESSGTNNPWFVGVPGTNNPPAPMANNKAYLSDNGGTARSYNVANPCQNYFWRDVTVPSGQTKINLTFNWEQQGEASWDIIQVYTAPTSITPVGGNTHPGSGTSNVPAAIAGATFVTNTSPQTGVQTVTAFLPTSLAGTTFRLIFLWKSDTSGGTQPPAALDNISLVSSVPGNYVSVATGDWTAPATWGTTDFPTPVDNATISTGHTVTINALNLGINNLAVTGTLTFNATATTMIVNGNLAVNTGGVFNIFQGTTGKRLNLFGNLSNSGTIDLSVGASSTGTGTNGVLNLTGSTAQTISGLGAWTGNAIRNMLCSNTSTATPNIIWGVSNVAVMHNLNLTGARIDLNGNTFLTGNVTANNTTLTVPGGTGFFNGIYGRYFTTGQTGSALTAGSDPTTTTSQYPFINTSGQNRSIWVSRSSSTTTGNTAGYVTAQYFDAAGISSITPVIDGSYTLNRQFNGYWTISTTGGYVYVSGTHLIQTVTPFAYFPNNANSRLMYQSSVIGTHEAGTATPGARRTGLTTAQLTGGNWYMAINNADLPYTTVSNGIWSDAAVWDSGLVPTCNDPTLVLHRITVNSAGNVARGVTVGSNGQLRISSGDLTVDACTPRADARFDIGAGSLLMEGGTLTVRGSFRTLETPTGIFRQTGGDIIVDGNNGVTLESVTSHIVDLWCTNAGMLDLTGGTFTVVDPPLSTTSTNCAFKVFPYIGLNVSSGTGWQLNLGNGSVTNNGGHSSGYLLNLLGNTAVFRIGNLRVNTGIGGTNRFVNTSNNLPLTNLTVNSGEYRTGSTHFINGNVVVNANGTLSWTGTINFSDWNGSAGIQGSIAQQITNNGVVQNLTSAPTANLSSLTLNNLGGLTLNSPLTMSGTLLLTKGIINTTSTNSLRLGTITAAATLSTSSLFANDTHINGPLLRTLGTATASNTFDNTRLYPTGKGGVYFPIWLSPTTTAPTIFTAEAFNDMVGTSGPGVSMLSDSRWAISANTPANITAAHVQLGDANIVSTRQILQAPTAAGVYSSIVTGTLFAAGTPPTIRTSPNGSPIPAASYTGFFKYGELTPCFVPSAQPTTLVFSGISSTSLTGMFTAASPTPDGYIIVRYAAGATPTNPVNGTGYTPGGSLGVGTVVAVGTPTTFNVTGLTINTSYDFYVYSYNAIGCGGGPIYLTTSPLFATVTTCNTLVNPITGLVTTARSQNTFNIQWTASTTPGVSYFVDVATDVNFTNIIQSNLSVGTGTTYQITGLVAGTTYSFRVRAFDGVSGCFSTNVAATNGTLCPGTNTPYLENLNGALTCLSLITFSGSPSWAVGAAPVTPSGMLGNTARITSSTTAATNALFITQALNLTGGTAYDFRFKYGNTTTSATLSLELIYSAANPGDGAIVIGNNVVMGAINNVNNTVSNTATFAFIPPTSGQYYVMFRAFGPIAGSTSTVHVDDLEVVVTPPCSAANGGTAVSSLSGSFCGNTNTTSLSATGYTYSLGMSYQWEKSTDNTNWTNMGSVISHPAQPLTPVVSDIFTVGNNFYRLRATCANGPVTGFSTTVGPIVYSNPQPLTTTGGSRCGTGTVNLSATANGGDNLNWYANPTGGAPIGTGTSFTTPSISTTTPFYVSAVSGFSTLSGLGNLDIPTATGALNSRGIVFTANGPMTILSAQYYSPTLNVTNTVTVRLFNNTTNVQIGSDLVLPIVQGAVPSFYTLTLNLSVPEAGSYRLLAGFSSSVNRITSGVNYALPQFNNLGSFGVITSGFGDSGVTATEYNYFHNISASAGCEGTRTAVTATVAAPPALTLSSNAQTICEASSSPTINITSTISDYDTYVWSPMTGVSGTPGTGYTFNPTTTTTYTLTATQTNPPLCANTAQVVVTVNPRPTITSATATPATLNCGDNSQLDVVVPSTLSTYTYTNNTSPFTLLSGATQVAPSNANNDDGISAPLNIGFTFNYGGTPFTQFLMNTNGWITFDITATTATTNYSSLNGTVNNIIAAYSGDLTSTGSAMSILTSGSPGSQICRIQWTNTTEFTSTEVPDLSSFQIWLYEGTNVIEIRYGSFGVGTRTGAQSPLPQVGLRGTSTASTQILSLGSATNWAAATAGNVSSTAMPATVSVLPDNGRRYTFTPKVFNYSWTPTTYLNNPAIRNPMAMNIGGSITYNVVVTDVATGCSRTSDNVVITANNCAIALNTKVFLSSVSGGTMDDYLRTLSGEFPLTDPYTTAPYSTSGLFTYVPAQTPATTTQTILDNNNVVDWVFVELRTGTSGSTTVTASKSGLLKNDGVIINPDGTPFSFSGVAAGNYFIAIKHRNHCGFMTDGTIAVPNPSLLNLTDGSVTLYEPNHAALKLQGGVYAMWTGDATVDGSVDGGDVNFIRPLSGTIIDEYERADVNLDGGVDGGDVNLTRANSGNVGYQID